MFVVQLKTVAALFAKPFNERKFLYRGLLILPSPKILISSLEITLAILGVVYIPSNSSRPVFFKISSPSKPSGLESKSHFCLVPIRCISFKNLDFS